MKSIGFVALLAIAGSAFGQASYTGGAYLENFDTLPNVGAPTTAPWTDNVTLSGWYSRSLAGTVSNTDRDPGAIGTTVIRPTNGSVTSGGLHSFGTTGSSERALGSIGSGSAENTFALVLTNNSGNTYSSFTMAFTSEQWRDGGQGTFAPVQHRFVFDYIVVSSFAAAMINAENVAGYTADPNLDAISVISNSTAAALDGNLPANQSARSGGGSFLWAPGETLILRWWDNNDAGNDHGIGLDNLSFEAVPTPGAAGLAGLASLVVLRRRRA